MSLPTQEQLKDLTRRIKDIETGQHPNIPVDGNWYSEIKKGELATAASKIKEHNKLKAAANFVIPKAASSGVTHALAAVGVTTGSAVFPIAVVFAPWITAATIVIKSNGLYSLYDIKENINKGLPNSYTCYCNECSENIKYIIRKKERKTAVHVTSIFTAGVPSAAQTMNSIRKHFQSGRPKELKCKSLVQSAKNGCTAAMATIFHLSGGSFFTRRTEEEVMTKAIAIIFFQDWKELKKLW